ncbi:hypothetical protein D3C87_1793460 [compost metagenome]
MATNQASLGKAFIRIALSAPVARAFRIVASVLASPTVITVTVPLPPSAKSIAFDKAISS